MAKRKNMFGKKLPPLKSIGAALASGKTLTGRGITERKLSRAELKRVRGIDQGFDDGR